MALAVAAAVFVAIAAYHSIGGEQALVGPLVRDRHWSVPGLGRRPARELLRGAWHMTTVAWVALAAVALGVDPAIALAVTALLSGLALLVRLPGHPAWPLFALVALLAGRGAGAVTTTTLDAVTIAAALVAAAAAALHLLWATGRSPKTMRAALPTGRDGEPAFRPSPPATALVALALATLATFLVLATTRSTPFVDVAVALAGLVLTARAIGDRRQVGFSKTDRTTEFAVRDDRLYTPIVVLLATGCLTALLP